MSREGIRTSRRAHVIVAIAVVLILAGVLGARLAARSGGSRGDAPELTAAERAGSTVPAPQAFQLEDLEIPHWSHQNSREWPVRFRTDLDLLAPLGTGTRNAGEWFVDFRKPDGPRYEEARAMMDRREDRGEYFGKVLPQDDPLLLEAEPWCDQAVMHYYPDLLKPNGWYTQIPNLLVPLTFARSWIARGVESPDPERGLEDCRRAIRLGRLLRQEDTVIISDLVGLACIRIGAQGIYDIAVKRGDLELAVLASIVIGEVAPQRLHTSERITRKWDQSFIQTDETGAPYLALPDEKLDIIVEMIRNQPDRRFRAEAILTLNVVRFYGTDAQRDVAIDLLEELRNLDDPMISETARWSLEVEPTPDQLVELQ